MVTLTLFILFGSGNGVGEGYVVPTGQVVDQLVLKCRTQASHKGVYPLSFIHALVGCDVLEELSNCSRILLYALFRPLRALIKLEVPLHDSCGGPELRKEGITEGLVWGDWVGSSCDRAPSLQTGVVEPIGSLSA
jgi:hypothetical protein